MPKWFPLWVNTIVGCGLLGIAVGMATEHYRAFDVCILVGLGIGVSIVAIARAFIAFMHYLEIN